MWLFYGFFLSFLFYYRCLPRCTRLPPFAAPNSFTTSTPFLPLSSHISNSITSRLTMIYEDNIVKQTQRQSWKRITGKKETSTNIILVAWWKKVKSILWLVKLIGVILFYGCKLDAVFFFISPWLTLHGYESNIWWWKVLAENALHFDLFALCYTYESIYFASFLTNVWFDCNCW